MADTHIKINAVTPKVQYTGNGVTTVFPYEFPIFDETDMVVYVGDDIIESGYTVTGAGETEGGTVVFDTAPDDGAKITLLRNVPIERLTDFQEGGTFRPKNLNDEFDRQTAFIQQVQEQLDRAVMTGPTSDLQPEEVLEQIERVYPHIDEIDTVADDISNVNTVASNITNINAVNSNKTNIDTVAENISDIKDKANKDMDNLTTTGKSTVAKLGMPSNSYTTLTLGASGTEYTAPTNGYFALAALFDTSSSLYIYHASTPRYGTTVEYTSNSWTEISLPVKSGEKVIVQYGGTADVQYFSFIKAEGDA